MVETDTLWPWCLRCHWMVCGPASRPRRVTHDRETPYWAAASASVRPSTTTAAITKRAFDMAKTAPGQGSDVLNHHVPMS